MIKSFPIAVVSVAFAVPAFVSAEVSTPRQLADRPAAHCQAPRWAPDGSHLAYEVYNPKEDARETWLIKFTADGRKDGEDSKVDAGRGGKASQLLKGRLPPVVDFEWAPDMKLIVKPYVFSSRGPKKNFDLFADGQWLTSNPGNDGQPAWSPDGQFIAYASQQKDSGDIYLLDLGGDPKPQQLTFWPQATELNPRWSPNGKSLLFTRSRSGSKGQDIGLIVDVAKARDTVQMVTEWEGDEIRPSWAPNGKLIAFYANKGQTSDKNFDLWVVDIVGKTAKKIDSDVVVDDHRGVVWTPDSTVLFYVKKDFGKNNPVRWAKADASQSGTLDTGTQLNSDLALFGAASGKLQLAFKALGQTGSTNKTWERLFMITFAMSDLKAGQ